MPSNACFSSPKASGIASLRQILRGIAWLYPDIGYCQGTGVVSIKPHAMSGHAKQCLLIFDKHLRMWRNRNPYSTDFAATEVMYGILQYCS